MKHGVGALHELIAEIMAIRVKLVVASVDAVRVHHGNNDEDESLEQRLALHIVGISEHVQQEVDQNVG